MCFLIPYMDIFTTFKSTQLHSVTLSADTLPYIPNYGSYLFSLGVLLLPQYSSCETDLKKLQGVTCTIEWQVTDHPSNQP